MTVFALAAAQGWLVRERIAGIALMSTTAGRVAGAGITRVLDTPAHRLLEIAADRSPTWLARCWRAIRRHAAPLLGPVFGGESITGAKFLAEARSDITTIVELLTDMKTTTPSTPFRSCATFLLRSCAADATSSYRLGIHDGWRPRFLAPSC
jgi:hypothetical protein